MRIYGISQSTVWNGAYISKKERRGRRAHHFGSRMAMWNGKDYGPAEQPSGHVHDRAPGGHDEGGSRLTGQRSCST